MNIQEQIKIIYIGASSFAATILEALIKSNDVSILAIITNPDKMMGRRYNKVSIDPCALLGSQNNISLLKPESLNNVKEIIKGLQPDFIVVSSYGKKISGEILNIPKFGALNVHPSLLPKYRGATPIQSALLNGDKETGVSIIKMNDYLDRGDMILIKRFPILDEETYKTLCDKLAFISADLLFAAISGLYHAYLKPIPQNNSLATYCHKFSQISGELNFHSGVKIIYNKIRALNPEPSTYTYFKQKQLKILEALSLECSHNNPIGKVLLHNNKLAIACSQGYILPKIVQLEGKNKMDINQFLRGRADLVGATLPS